MRRWNTKRAKLRGLCDFPRPSSIGTGPTVNSNSANNGNKNARRKCKGVGEKQRRKANRQQTGPKCNQSIQDKRIRTHEDIRRFFLNFDAIKKAIEVLETPT